VFDEIGVPVCGTSEKVGVPDEQTLLGYVRASDYRGGAMLPDAEVRLRSNGVCGRACLSYTVHAPHQSSVVATKLTAYPKEESGAPRARPLHVL